MRLRDRADLHVPRCDRPVFVRVRPVFVTFSEDECFQRPRPPSAGCLRSAVPVAPLDSVRVHRADVGPGELVYVALAQRRARVGGACNQAGFNPHRMVHVCAG
jgi:hypothetical protein